MNGVEFVISKEDLISGPGTRLDPSRAFAEQSFIFYFFDSGVQFITPAGPRQQSFIKV